MSRPSEPFLIYLQLPFKLGVGDSPTFVRGLATLLLLDQGRGGLWPFHLRLFVMGHGDKGRTELQNATPHPQLVFQQYL